MDGKVGTAVLPVILSGGSGSRLWPMSRELFPKQLQALLGTRTMLQETVERVSGPAFEAPMVVCNDSHRFIIAEQMRQMGVTPGEIVLEPVARNSAPAIAVGALRALERFADPLILVLAADHRIGDVAAFRAAVAAAVPVAAAGHLVAFGITPTGPATGYGYIRKGAPVGDGASRVDRFVEKPPLADAERMVADGRHLWNGGLFLFPARTLIEEMERLAPAVVAAARAGVAAARRDIDFLRLDATAFAASPDISIDYAVMEKTDRAAVVPMDVEWSDIGSWAALWDVAEKDAAGNAVVGDAVFEGTRNSYVRSDSGLLTAVVGLDDVVVVTTEDAVLVCARDKAQDVKKVVERLKAAGREEPTVHRRVYRPWGFYQTLERGERFQVKRLTVYPGRQLSLQRHFHRAEHWVVVNGTALVECGEKKTLVGENESVYIPLAARHRLANPGKVLLNLIEVQSGPYLGEDDIVRYDETLEVRPDAAE
jgi:mannose-1-phosphate guanylyltransferase/mannose-1-phosphate guanylyltransferase/mannose-6-phosphate isomerase